MKSVLELEELANLAIKAALAQQWSEAVTLNLQLLTDDPQNVEALNRLGRAHQELGQAKEAKKAYLRVLEADTYNTIAQKQLAKLEQGTTMSSTSTAGQSVFLEEPGKTRTTVLSQPQAKKLSQLTSGEELKLEERQGRLAVAGPHGGLVGYVQDDLGSHLLNLMHLGNTYSAHLMSSAIESPQIFLRETEQSEQAAKFVSFTRSHAANHAGTTVRDGVTKDDGFPLDPANPEEEGDNWEDNNEEAPLDPDDDFHTVSLENMRDEEEEERSPYSAREDY